MTLNIENLHAVRDKIAAQPEHCYMGTWWGKGAPGRRSVFDPNLDLDFDGEPECGTTACIAGWGVVHKYGSLENFRSYAPDSCMSEVAQQHFGLRGEALFFEIEWPEHYAQIAEAEGDAKGMLALLDALIAGTVVEEYNEDEGEWQLVDTLEGLIEGKDGEDE